MKFLLFNIVVIGALIYLVSTENTKKVLETGSSALKTISKTSPENLVRSTAKKVSETASAISTMKDPRSGEDNKKSGNPDNSAGRSKASIDTEEQVRSQRTNKIPRHEVRETDEINVDPPKYARVARPKPVRDNESVGQNGLMSKVERRRELNKLAREMELMFADKLSN